MLIVSWNINGIRAVYKKGFLGWLNANNPDIVCLQETKAEFEQFPEEIRNHSDYELFQSSAQKKGYSGVALLVKKDIPLIGVVEGLGREEFDSEGRTLILEHQDFILFNGYYPNGQRDHGRVSFKLSYSQNVLDKASELRKTKNKEIILAGDFNTAHKEIDLANPKSNTKTTGFLPNERQWLDHLVLQGYQDVFREFHKDEEGHYTWWTYRNNCRERNIGWRIDYFFATEGIASKVKSCDIQPQVLGSDHAPIHLTL